MGKTIKILNDKEKEMAKNTNNYFTSSINKYNTEDFVTLMAPELISQNGEDIFRIRSLLIIFLSLVKLNLISIRRI